MELLWSDKSGKKLFSDPYIDLLKGNNLPDLFEKIKKTGDDRSRIILCNLILEFQTDTLLEYLIKNYKGFLMETHPSFFIKLSLLNSFDLIPEKIFKSIDCLRTIRNEFAHNLAIDKFKDLNDKVISKIDQIVLNTSYNRKKHDILGSKIFSIEFHAIVGLECYEPNIRLLSEQINNKVFKDRLTTEYKKRLKEQTEVLNKYFKEQ